MNQNNMRNVVVAIQNSIRKLFTEDIRHLGIKQIMTSYRSPWQNGYVERVIGSIKRECLDQIIILNEEFYRDSLFPSPY